jgi:hypothetical protein
MTAELSDAEVFGTPGGFADSPVGKYITAPIKALEPEAPVPWRETLPGRIIEAGVKGFREAEPFYKPELHAAVDQGPVGRFITNPVLDTAKGVVGALAGGAGQAAYETGAAIGGPRLGRDFYVLNQLAPAAVAMPGVVKPGGGPVSADTIVRNTVQPWEDARTPVMRSGEAFPPGVPDYGMTREQRIQQFLSEQPPEAVAEMAKTNPDAAAWLAERAGAAERQGLAEGAGTTTPETSAGTTTPEVPAGPVTTSAQAKAVASGFYKAADDAGGTLTPGFANKFFDKVDAVIPQTEAGKAIAGESPTSALVARIQPLRDKPMTLQAAQEVDEALGTLIDKEYGIKGLSKEGNKLLDIQHSFRDHILSAGPDDIVGGSAGFDALSQGRQAWSQARKMDDLERIQERANMTDNPATSVKTQIRTLLTNRSKVRGYSDEEVAALQEAAQRGTVGSLLHVFGSRLVPLAAGAAEVGAHGLGGGLLAAGLTHLGTAKLRDWGAAMQQNRLSNAINVVGQGVPSDPLRNQFMPPPPNP